MKTTIGNQHLSDRELSHHESASDILLIQEALQGNRHSLEKLIKSHQDFIYNVALRMYLHPDDALDATQDVLIKIITHLKTFQGGSQFRTWLYRIVVNHFLNAPQRQWEKHVQTIEHHAENIMYEEPDFSEHEIEEVRILCSTAMLMCLNREQRLLYIIGEIFGADHNLGALIFDISPVNFRVKLHRAKMDLLHYVSGKCGIINPSNPCRCPKKTKIMIQHGVVDKQKLQFNRDYTHKVSEWVIQHKNDVSDTVQFRMKELFLDSPYQIKQELDALIGSVIL